MSRIRNTEQLSLLSCPSSLRGKKRQAASVKLDKSSNLRYYRINGKVQQRSRFVGPSHITNRRHAHLVRSSMRAARSTLGSARQPTVVVACADPGDRDLKHQASSTKLSKIQAASSKPQAASLKLQAPSR
jgi:hypothetical protein